MFEEIIKTLKESNNILIFIHSNPDGDAVGSASAFQMICENFGKKAEIVIESPLDVMYSMIKGDFRVMGTEDEYDLAVSLDCGDKERMGETASLFKGKTINIDHHIGNDNFADINHVEPYASATGEILYKMIKENNIPITKDMANSLYAAVLTDTGGFMYQNTSAFTHRMIADLMDCKADYYELNKSLIEEKTYHKHQVAAKCIDNIDFFENGKVAISLFTNDFCNDFNITKEDLGGAPAVIRSVSGVEVGALITEIEKNIVKVSLRSDKIVDVSKIASKFGGGGHMRASGITFKDTDIFAVKDMLVKEILKEF